MFKKDALYIKLFFGTLIALTFLAIGCMPAETEFETPEFAGVRAAATEGYYIDRVQVSWSDVEDAATYTIYRADSIQGLFEEIAVVDPNDTDRHSEYAEDITFYPPPIVHPDDWIDPRYLNVNYVSQVDLTKNLWPAMGNNIYIIGTEKPQLRIIVGYDSEIDVVAEFPSLVDWLPTTWRLGYTIGQVASIINGAVNKGKDPADFKFICEIDPDTGKYLKFSSKWGPIVFINHKNSVSHSPVHYIINGAVGNDQIIIVNKDETRIYKKSEFDSNPNLWNYRGNEIPPDPDPEPVVLMRTFPEGNIYYYDDRDIELGKHYFYRVIARRDNGSFLSMSSMEEGYYVAPTAPSGPKNVKVSQGDFSDRVTVSWDPVSGDGVTYKVYRALVYPGTFDSNAPFAEGLTEPILEDTTIPAGVYAYRIVPCNGAGEEGRPSDTATGFRSITLEEFVRVAYYETVRGEKRVAQALGVGRVADYDSGANANVTLPGNISGTVNYRLVVSGTSGTGTWTFLEYSNFGLTVNGSDYMDSGMNKNGDVRGKLTYSGPYPGYIDYFVHVNGGDASVGPNSYFKVQLYSPEWMIENYGSAEVEVPYSPDLWQSPY